MIVNRQKRIAIAPRKLEWFLARVMRTLHGPREGATVCLVTDTQIAKWNHLYRGRAKPTDVLSFPAESAKGHRAKRAASSRVNTLRRKKRNRQGGTLAVPNGHRGSGVVTRKVRQSALRGNAATQFRGKGVRARNSLEVPAESFYLGDIAIAPAVALRNAIRFGRTFEDEMRILILHGVLHLLGYDHERDHGEMERLELRLRRRLGIA